MNLKVITKKDLIPFVGVGQDELLSVETAFVNIAKKNLIMPPIQRMDFPEENGEIDIKSASYPGTPGFVVKMSTGFFNNPKKGLPSGSGMMILFSTTTGMPLDVFLDGGYLTNVRTGLAGGIAAKYLAPKEIKLGVVGCGAQAFYQLKAISLVRKLDNVFVWGRSLEKANIFTDQIKTELKINIEPVNKVEDLIAHSNTVVTTTPAQSPIIKDSMVNKKDLLFICMGSDSPDKNEVDPKVLMRASQIVADSIPQCRKNGELHHALSLGIKNDQVVELGDVILENDLNKYEKGLRIVDLTGTGAQDNAISNFAHLKMKDEKIGTPFEF